MEMTESVSKFERWWLEAWPHRFHIRRFVPHFLRESPDPFRGEVLEVGSGSGWTSRRILETFPQVELTATDLDPRAEKGFEKLGKRYGRRLTFRQADLLKLPFDRDAFDIVVALHMLHHVADLDKAIRELLRVTRPGGLIGIADENPDFWPKPMRWLFRTQSHTTRARLEGLLTDEGCEILTQHGTVHYFLWARKQYPVAPPT